MKKWIIIALMAVMALAVLGAIGPNPRFIEELSIGGGKGDLKDGGADFEKNGAITTDGTINTDATFLTNGTPIASADLADAATIAILNENETVTGDWTFDAATLTLTGDVAVNGGDITSTAATLRIAPATQVHIDGKLGVGTGSPVSILHSVATNTFDLLSTSAGQDGLFVTGAGTTGSGNFGNGIMFSRVDGATTERHAGIASVQTAVDANRIGLAFFTHPTNTGSDPIVEAMRITAIGNVGLGTTSPYTTLEVSKTSTFTTDTSAAFVVTNPGDTNEQIQFGYDTTADVGYLQGIKLGIGFENLALNARGGNVGIGTVSPSTPLDVVGNGTFSGDLAVNGGDLTSSAATVGLFDATPTTINFGGAATTMTIGAPTGATTVDNDLFVNGGFRMITLQDGTEQAVPNMSNVNTLLLEPDLDYDITDFTPMASGQIIYVVNLNAAFNVTIKEGTEIKMKAGVDLVLSQWDGASFIYVNVQSSDIWVQL